MSHPPGRPKDGSLPPGGKSRSDKGAPLSEALVRVEKSDEGYAIVTLNRPEALNALSRRMRADLTASFAALEADPAVRVVILTGAGRAFCAGLDLKEWSGGEGEVAAGAFDSDPVQAILSFSGPVIGAINGLAITGALEMTVACDVVYASTAAKFADTHVHAGLLPGWGLSVRLCRAVGVQRAKEISLSGNFFSAEQFLAYGVVNRVCSPEELLPQAIALARNMLAGDTATVVAYKKLIDSGFALDFDSAVAAEKATAQAHNAGSSAATIEKRLAELKTRARTFTK